MNDLTLLLPDKRELKQLSVCTDPSIYCEPLQRVVCTLLLTDMTGMTVNGMTITEALSAGTASSVGLLNSMVGLIASELKTRLNKDSYDIQDIKITPAVDGSSVRLDINITTVDGVSTTGEMYL